jgi:hypothetical protein
MTMTEKRSLRVEKVPASTMLKIAWNGGGEVPPGLQGHFTSHFEAKAAIANWLAANGKEVEVTEPKLDEQAEKTKRGRPPIQPI